MCRIFISEKSQFVMYLSGWRGNLKYQKHFCDHHSSKRLPRKIFYAGDGEKPLPFFFSGGMHMSVIR
jgi:hypothetical protein